MATPTKKSKSEIDAEVEIIRRHLRRRCRVQWRESDPLVGDRAIMNWNWTIDLSTVEDEDKNTRYQVAMFLREPSDGIDRYYCIQAADTYGAIHQFVSIFTLVELIERNDLKQDDF